MRLRVLGTLILSALGVMALNTARADDGPWEVRLRAVYLAPENNSDAINGLLPANAVYMNNKWLPDLDFEYFFTPHWSAELVLTYPQTQDVYVSGTKIGTFKHLPPVLTAKYNFRAEAQLHQRRARGAGGIRLQDSRSLICDCRRQVCRAGVRFVPAGPGQDLDPAHQPVPVRGRHRLPVWWTLNLTPPRDCFRGGESISRVMISAMLEKCPHTPLHPDKLS